MQSRQKGGHQSAGRPKRKTVHSENNPPAHYATDTFLHNKRKSAGTTATTNLSRGDNAATSNPFTQIQNKEQEFRTATQYSDALEISQTTKTHKKRPKSKSRCQSRLSQQSLGRESKKSLNMNSNQNGKKVSRKNAKSRKRSAGRTTSLHRSKSRVSSSQMTPSISAHIPPTFVQEEGSPGQFNNHLGDSNDATAAQQQTFFNLGGNSFHQHVQNQPPTIKEVENEQSSSMIFPQQLGQSPQKISFGQNVSGNAESIIGAHLVSVKEDFGQIPMDNSQYFQTPQRIFDDKDQSPLQNNSKCLEFGQKLSQERSKRLHDTAGTKRKVSCQAKLSYESGQALKQATSKGNSTGGACQSRDPSHERIVNIVMTKSNQKKGDKRQQVSRDNSRNNADLPDSNQQTLSPPKFEQNHQNNPNQRIVTEVNLALNVRKQTSPAKVTTAQQQTHCSGIFSQNLPLTSTLNAVGSSDRFGGGDDTTSHQRSVLPPYVPTISSLGKLDQSKSNEAIFLNKVETGRTLVSAFGSQDQNANLNQVESKNSANFYQSHRGITTLDSDLNHQNDSPETGNEKLAFAMYENLKRMQEEGNWSPERPKALAQPKTKNSTSTFQKSAKKVSSNSKSCSSASNVRGKRRTREQRKTPNSRQVIDKNSSQVDLLASSMRNLVQKRTKYVTNQSAVSQQVIQKPTSTFGEERAEKSSFEVRQDSESRKLNRMKAREYGNEASKKFGLSRSPQKKQQRTPAKKQSQTRNPSQADGSRTEGLASLSFNRQNGTGPSTAAISTNLTPAKKSHPNSVNKSRNSSKERNKSDNSVTRRKIQKIGQNLAARKIQKEFRRFVTSQNQVEQELQQENERVQKLFEINQAAQKIQKAFKASQSRKNIEKAFEKRRNLKLIVNDVSKAWMIRRTLNSLANEVQDFVNSEIAQEKSLLRIRFHALFKEVLSRKLYWENNFQQLNELRIRIHNSNFLNQQADSNNLQAQSSQNKSAKKSVGRHSSSKKMGQARQPSIGEAIPNQSSFEVYGTRTPARNSNNLGTNQSFQSHMRQNSLEIKGMDEIKQFIKNSGQKGDKSICSIKLESSSKRPNRGGDGYPTCQNSSFLIQNHLPASNSKKQQQSAINIQPLEESSPAAAQSRYRSNSCEKNASRFMNQSSNNGLLLMTSHSKKERSALRQTEMDQEVRTISEEKSHAAQSAADQQMLDPRADLVEKQRLQTSELRQKISNAKPRVDCWNRSASREKSANNHQRNHSNSLQQTNTTSTLAKNDQEMRVQGVANGSSQAQLRKPRPATALVDTGLRSSRISHRAPLARDSNNTPLRGMPPKLTTPSNQRLQSTSKKIDDPILSHRRGGQMIIQNGQVMVSHRNANNQNQEEVQHKNTTQSLSNFEIQSPALSRCKLEERISRVQARVDTGLKNRNLSNTQTGVKRVVQQADELNSVSNKRASLQMTQQYSAAGTPNQKAQLRNKRSSTCLSNYSQNQPNRRSGLKAPTRFGGPRDDSTTNEGQTRRKNFERFDGVEQDPRSISPINNDLNVRQQFLTPSSRTPTATNQLNRPKSALGPQNLSQRAQVLRRRYITNTNNDERVQAQPKLSTLLPESALKQSKSTAHQNSFANSGMAQKQTNQIRPGSFRLQEQMTLVSQNIAMLQKSLDQMCIEADQSLKLTKGQQIGGNSFGLNSQLRASQKNVLVQDKAFKRAISELEGQFDLLKQCAMTSHNQQNSQDTR